MELPRGQYPMGEIQNQTLQLSFNASLKVDFQGSRVTSDGGLILVREHERLGFGELIERATSDGLSPPGRIRSFPSPTCWRQSVYSRLAGYKIGRSEY